MMKRNPTADSSLLPLLRQAIDAHRTGALGAAEQLYTQILSISPKHAEASYNLALLLAESGRIHAAKARLEKLLKAHPRDGAALYSLGKIHRSEGALTKSIFHYRRALESGHDRLDTYLELISAYGMQGNPDEAWQIGRLGLSRFPDSPEIPTQVGVAAVTAGRREDARGCFQDALRIRPDFPLALYFLGKLTEEQGRLAAALGLYRNACAADPTLVIGLVNLGDLELRLGEVDSAIARFDAALAIDPAHLGALSSRVMAAQYQPGVTAASLAKIHQIWDRQVGNALFPGQKRHVVSPDPDRKLRIGVVSADLCEHPVGWFTVRAIEALDPDAFEIIAYAGVTYDDPIAMRFRQRADDWFDTSSWSDAKLATEIASDRIDILLDLTGHTRGERLGAFARKPAPVQISWAGYVGTTGLSAMDGLIADRFHVPEAEEPFYTETIIRLPDSFMCFDPPGCAPAVSALPAGTDRPLTFSAFHNPAKINKDVVELWARVLRGHASSRLCFGYAGYEVPDVQSRILQWFSAAGVGGEQISFTGRLPRQELLHRYGTIDLALDPFPYSGSTTTCEALWMGVPVVTLPGKTFAGRHSRSFLSTIGLDEMIARDPDDYVGIVSRLNADRPRLQAIRLGLRERMARSPLCDGKAFGQHLGAALRHNWKTWCARVSAGRAEP